MICDDEFSIFALTNSHTMINEALIARMRDHFLARKVKNEEKRMFGGVAFMIRGNMCVGVTNKGELMVRIHPDEHAKAIKKPGARPMEYGHGPMPGFLFITEEGSTADSDLHGWIELCLKYNAMMPEKKAGEKKSTKKKVVAVKSPTKKAAPKKAVIKKELAKKVIAKKTATKKSVVKKGTVKKTVAKKTIVKKASAKKFDAKKVDAKKSVAKKAAANKSVAKEVAAKKTMAKKGAAKR